MVDDKSSSPLHFSRPRHISWLTIVLALLAVGTFLAIAQRNPQYYVTLMMGGSGGYSTSYDQAIPPPMSRGAIMDETSVSNVPMMAQGKGGGVSADYAYAPDYYPYPSPDVPATDTRELLKVNYNASMRTRDVPGLVRRVETTVRGYSGRIDQESSSPQSGYVNFVIPMSKYEAFRTELESMVWSKLLTVNIQSSNMLPQKQSIEEQQKQADSTLADYQTARQKLVNNHASNVKSLQAQIDSDAQILATLRAQTPTYDIQTQIQTVSDDWSSLKQQLANENASYKQQLGYADDNIQSAKDWQTAVKTQDQALLDNVATVSGSVSIQWISLWDMVQLYLPGYWIPAIFAALAFLSYLYDRRRFGVV